MKFRVLNLYQLEAEDLSEAERIWGDHGPEHEGPVLLIRTSMLQPVEERRESE